MRISGSHFGALYSHLFQSPSGFSLGCSCSLSHILAISVTYPWSRAICMSLRASFRTLTVHLAERLFPSGPPGASPPCVCPKSLPTFFPQSLSPVFPRTYLLCIFLRVSPLKLPPTDSIHVSPSTFHHVSQKSILPMSLAPNSCFSCANMCELEFHRLPYLAAEIAFSIATPQCCQLFPVQTWVIKPPNHHT